MGDVAITPANVQKSANASPKQGISLAAIAAGDVIAKDTATGKFTPADANGAGDLSNVVGVALCSAPGANQPFFYTDDDPDFVPGGTLVPGLIYVASATPGKMAPAGDLVTGWKTTSLGVAKSTTNMVLKVVQSATAVG